MKAEHREVFFRVAEKHSCQIGVREPNPLSERWIGKAGCTPKSMQCKAKTSDNPSFAYSGLVTSPELRAEAFTAATLESARQTWRRFAPDGKLPVDFSVQTKGLERGLVLYQNYLRIYADYDLMAIVRSDPTGKFQATSQEEQQALFKKVHAELNAALGAPLIQHGAEFMWDGGLGARARESVFWFGPRRSLQVSPSSMPPEGH
jgi:hypothetical protein